MQYERLLAGMYPHHAIYLFPPSLEMLKKVFLKSQSFGLAQHFHENDCLEVCSGRFVWWLTLSCSGLFRFCGPVFGGMGNGEEGGVKTKTKIVVVVFVG
jgi:hypothetical protein